jgi:hypothetical protein
MRLLQIGDAVGQGHVLGSPAAYTAAVLAWDG